jgi:hypothetical protein
VLVIIGKNRGNSSGFSACSRYQYRFVAAGIIRSAGGQVESLIHSFNTKVKLSEHDITTGMNSKTSAKLIFQTLKSNVEQ